jgi:regulator of protease activity HflC (stomatin/prohibitin superfamily)
MNALQTTIVIAIVAIGLTGLITAARAVRVVQQYERGVVFRFGRVRDGSRGPGLTLIVPGVGRLVKVNLLITTMSVPAQDGITRDNVSVRVDAVVYFRVVDPVKALVNVNNYVYAVSQVAQTSLRAVIGRADLDELLADRDKLNSELTSIIDAPTEGPWGVKVERVEVKDVALPESMKRSISRQAEAERERRARVIAADGEYQAAAKLAQAAATMAADPAALQLRLLQTVVGSRPRRTAPSSCRSPSNSCASWTASRPPRARPRRPSRPACGPVTMPDVRRVTSEPEPEAAPMPVG